MHIGKKDMSTGEKVCVFLENIKFLFSIYKYGLLGILFLFTLVIIGTKLVNNMEILKYMDSTLLSTLLGAIVGGGLSLGGSVFINAREKRIGYYIKYKDSILTPLYNEMMKIKTILENNTYPKHIIVCDKKGSKVSYPQNSVWENIKLDTRFLEVPKDLKTKMDELYFSIESYLSMREESEREIITDTIDFLKNIGLDPHVANVVGKVNVQSVYRKDNKNIIINSICQKDLDRVKLKSDGELENLILKNLEDHTNIEQTRILFEKMMDKHNKMINLIKFQIQMLPRKY